MQFTGVAKCHMSDTFPDIHGNFAFHVRSYTFWNSKNQPT